MPQRSAQKHWLHDQIVLPILLSMVFVAVLSTHRGRAHPAPARRLLLAADPGAGGADLHHRLPLERGDRRRGRSGRSQARHARPDRSGRWARLLHVRGGDRAGHSLLPVARGALAVRARAGGDPREPAACHVPGLSRRALQAGGVRAFGRGDRHRRCAARFPDLPRLGRGHLGARSPASCWRWW